MKHFWMITIIMSLAMSISAQDAQTYGDKISGDDAISIKKAINMAETSDEAEVTVTGVVESVCQMKGCWMNVHDNNESDQTVFVKFKDYGFFVPMDIAGRKVTMKGVAFKHTTPVSELRHYAEDEGKSEAEIQAITEPKEEIRFTATGVIVH